jgi:phenylpropionate dioxygenase-like ring-hydroxylating dioxygenase large terminal subunit
MNIYKLLISLLIFNRSNSLTCLNQNNIKLSNDKKYYTTYNLGCYVVEEIKNIKSNKLYKVTVLNKDYIIWKDVTNKLYALDNECHHRGASLKNGYLSNNCVVCPYHGAEFNEYGKIYKMPGKKLEKTISSSLNQESYPIFEKNGWIYLNTNLEDNCYKNTDNDIFQEEETQDNNFSTLYINSIINANNRLVSENLLDVMHISYVHSFGNKDNPLPLNDPSPVKIKDHPNHYKITYFYKSGKESAVNRIFNIKDLIIENEFILPYTVVSRVKFGENIKTIVTFALPVTPNQTRLFVKVHRNYWCTNDNTFIGDVYNFFGDNIMKNILQNTIDEDTRILENIKYEYADGKYNMKYDKFSYMFRKMYESI